MSEHSIGMKRWIAKKAARWSVATGSLPLTISRHHADQLRVLTYHRFVDEVRSPFSVSPATLDRQIEWLASHRLAVGTDAAADIAAGAVPNRRAVVVTMDDGDPSVIDNAAPVFARHGIPYAVYVIPGRIGGKNHMSKAQIRELSDSGAEIGSHTMTHRSVTSLTARELKDELTRSKKAIEDITGRAVTSFAYPFGTLRDFDRRAGEALREAGYRIGFTSQHGPVTAGLDPMFLPRIKIEGGDPDWLFRAACAGAMDQWRFIDAGLSSLQKPEGGDLAAGADAAKGKATQA